MNKMLVGVFNSEKQAFEGLSALKELHKEGDITLYATAVLSKDITGTVNTRQAADEGPVGSAVGLLTGSMVGLLGGPVGMAVGASIGGLSGLMFDLDKSGIDIQFVEDVSKALSPGRSAVLADVEESWTAPVDARLEKLGGMVFRRLRSEVVEDQLAREAATFNAEMKQLEDELAAAHAEDKAQIKKQIEEAKKKLEVTRNQAQARIEQSEKERDARIASLKEQISTASERQKAKIQKRIEVLRTEEQARNVKLREAGRLAKEALALP